MPRTIVGKKFLIVARLLNDLANPAGRQLWPGLHTLERMELSIIARTIWIEQASGRNVSPHKLAMLLDIPRSTVERRVSDLIKKGIIVKTGRKYAVNSSWFHSEAAELRIERACRLIIKTAAEIEDLK